MTRGIEDWRNYIRTMIALESGSGMAAEVKIIGARELQAARQIIDSKIEDVDVRRKVAASFTVFTKYEALNEICGKHLADDPDLACEIAEAVAGKEANERSYLTS